MYTKLTNSGWAQLGKNLVVGIMVLVAMVAMALGDPQMDAADPVAEPNIAMTEDMETSVASEPEFLDVAMADDEELVEPQGEDQPPAVPSAEPASDEAVPEVVVTKVSDGADVQSFKFEKDFGIRDALALLASMYNKNIVPSAGVDGQLAFRALNEVTFEQALDAVLGDEFRYEDQGDMIKVYTKDEYKKKLKDLDRLTFEIFTLYYISAAEAQNLIQPVLSENAQVQATSASDILFPTDSSIAASAGGGDSTAQQDALVVYDYPENLGEVREIINKIDTRPLQVLVEATILVVSLTEDTQFGIDWSTLDNVITQLPGATPAAGDLLDGAADFFRGVGTSQVTNSGGLSIGVTHDDVGVFIRAVETITDVTIMANPKILAVNKQLGQVYIGTKIGYRSQTTQIDTSTTEKVEFLDTGTKLSFRPYIGNDGYIRMDIHPKDSSGELNAQGIPDETSAELVTNIMVRDGQTIVIGGLFRDKTSTKRTQVPLLGDLPWVGAAFRGTADSVTRQEVMILLTPHIIEEPRETDGEARAADVSRKRYAAKDALQWIDRPRLAEDDYSRAAQAYVEGDNYTALKYVKKSLKRRPTYLEAIRLKERIVKETDPAQYEKLERLVNQEVDEQEAPNWTRP